MSCYKATQPVGTDFRTGKTRYCVGATITHPSANPMLPNDPSTYLSVSVEPGEVLTGGGWPCRLWRVEPIGETVKRTDGRYPHKRGCKALRVIEELPAHLALGPNGEAVAALMAQLPRLNCTQIEQLRAAERAAWGAARGAARGAALGAAWGAARGAVLGAARDAALGAAWDAAWDATLALLVRDFITPEQFDTLYGPWRSVMGEERSS